MSTRVAAAFSTVVADADGYAPLDATHAKGRGEVRAWLRLVFRGDARELAPKALHRGLPEWFHQDLMREDDVTHALRPPNHGIGDGWARWALHRGIAPGQPFLVRLVEPRWSADYWGEWDCHYDGGLVAVEPWPLERVARQWERYLKALGA